MSGRRHRAPLVVGLCVAAAIALVLVRPGGAADSRTDPEHHVGPTRRGAVRAAVVALYALTVPAVTSRAQFEDAVRRLAAPGSRKRIESTFGAIDPALASAFRRPPRLLRAAPLGYRVERFTAKTASVAIWSVAIAASPGFPATAQWRTLVIDLAWTSRGWKVTGGDGTSGPDLTTPLRALADESSSFRSFAHVP